MKVYGREEFFSFFSFLQFYFVVGYQFLEDSVVIHNQYM